MAWLDSLSRDRQRQGIVETKPEAARLGYTGCFNSVATPSCVVPIVEGVLASSGSSSGSGQQPPARAAASVAPRALSRVSCRMHGGRVDGIFGILARGFSPGLGWARL